MMSKQQYSSSACNMPIRVTVYHCKDKQLEGKTEEKIDDTEGIEMDITTTMINQRPMRNKIELKEVSLCVR